MSSPLAHLATTFDYHTAALQKVLGGFDGADWLHRLGDTSHAYWLLGHLAYCRRSMARLAGEAVPEEAWEKQFGRGSKPDAGLTGIAPSDLLRDMIATGPRVSAQLRRLTPDQLTRDTGRTLPTGSQLGDVLSFLAFHEAYHLGQLGLIARTLGKPGLA